MVVSDKYAGGVCTCEDFGRFNELAVGYWGGGAALNDKIPACFLNSDQS